jgi:hypothetical protein
MYVTKNLSNFKNGYKIGESDWNGEKWLCLKDSKRIEHDREIVRLMLT